MAKYLKIILTPLAPYFFGSDRTLDHGDNPTQMGSVKKYYIRSNNTPNQSALFGVLRYLGIRNPKSNYGLTDEDKKRIGEKSFNLLDSTNDSFGMIDCVSPLYLYTKKDKIEKTFIPAPILAATADSGIKAKGKCYSELTTDRGDRWIPEFYDEKKANTYRFFCLETGELIDAPFKHCEKVVINRARNVEKGAVVYEKTVKKAFLKKSYVALKGYSFLFYAKVEDTFLPEEGVSGVAKIAYIGQGKCPFAVSVKEVDTTEGEERITLDFKIGHKFYKALSKALPDDIFVDGKERNCCYAVLFSDMYYNGSMEDLYKKCRFMIGFPKQYRIFTTNYNAQNSVGNKTVHGRFIKHDGVEMLCAGTTFVFKDENERNEFKEFIESSNKFTHGQIAGFNGIYYSPLPDKGQ